MINIRQSISKLGGVSDFKYFIFNINTTEVSGAVIFFDKKINKPVIEYSVKKKIFIESEDSLRNFRKNTESALRKTCEDIFKYMKISDDMFNVQDAFVFMSSPWVRKSVETLVEEKIRPFRVSAKFLEDFLENGYSNKDSEDLLHSEIISVKANGYEVLIGDVIDKEVSKLEISLMNSFISKNDKDFINLIIKESFSFITITNTSFLPTFFNQIKKIYDENDDFAFMDFTGEIMEFGIYKDNNIKNIISIKTGKNKIIRSLILNNLANSVSDGEYILSLYLRRELGEGVLDGVEKIIKTHVEQIENVISDELKKYDNFQIPKKVFVLSSGEMNHLLGDMNIFQENYFIGKTFLKNFVRAEEEKYFDNFLALESDYIFK